MKKRVCSFLLVVILIITTILTACSNEKSDSDDKESLDIVTCNNGKFKGAKEEETGILSFKGIPYAKAPIGELRWKAPVPVENSEETYDATEFGKSSIQYEWHSEPIQTERSEDCLTLNVWTKDLEGNKKPVMVFFHGGSFAWGGTSEDLYNGQYIVNEHNDVIVITCNYRVGMMGFIDLSSIEGGDAFPDSRELGMLDAIEALKWIKKNAESFGGDSDNITIFGESAGSTMVMGLMASDQTEGLFQRVICESGSVNLTYSDDDYKNSVQADMLLQATGAKNMDDLMALSEKELIEANELSLDEDDMTVNDYYSLPLRGGVIPENPYEGIKKAKERGIDVIIGTNTNEIAYWVAEMGEEPMTEMDEAGVKENLASYEEWFVEPQYESIKEMVDDNANASIDAFLGATTNKETLWAKTDLLTEAMFRIPSIKAAEVHADAEGEGKTYMYLFDKKSDNFDFIGACHASELAYVFHNLEETDFSGTVDSDLADRICTSWVNFAKTGDPSLEDTKWDVYDTTDRNTMVIGDDSSMKMEKDPNGETRQMLWPLSDYFIWAAGA